MSARRGWRGRALRFPFGGSAVLRAGGAAKFGGVAAARRGRRAADAGVKKAATPVQDRITRRHLQCTGGAAVRPRGACGARARRQRSATPAGNAQRGVGTRPQPLTAEGGLVVFPIAKSFYFSRCSAIFSTSQQGAATPAAMVRWLGQRCPFESAQERGPRASSRGAASAAGTRARGRVRVLRRDCTLRGGHRAGGPSGARPDAWRGGIESAARALHMLARDGNPAMGTRVSEETAQ